MWNPLFTVAALNFQRALSSKEKQEEEKEKNSEKTIDKEEE